MSHSRTWVALAALGSIVGLTIAVSLFSSTSAPGWSGYARSLGWAGIAVSMILVVQGFWKAVLDKRFMEQLRNDPQTASENHQSIQEKYTEARVRGWRVNHIILSILVATVAAFHSILLLPRLASPTPGVLLGVAGLAVLLLLGLSGLVMENKRKATTFGRLKKLHLWLMVSALTFAELHAVAAGSTFGNMGYAVSLGFLIGTLGLVGAGSVYAAMRESQGYFSSALRTRPCEGCGPDPGRRAALSKIGAVAVGTLVAMSFAEAAALLPKVIPAADLQQPQQQLTTKLPISNQLNGQGLGIKLGNLANIPVNSAYYFQHPQGKSNILIRLKDGPLVAFSSTCTHQPCTVGYDKTTGLIRCPCHGAVFDPSRGASVLQGPAPGPLPLISLTVDVNGDVWLA